MSIVVTIDGPAGTGKSTAARQLAQRLGFSFLDTGAMYRAVAWKCLQQNLDRTNHEAVEQVAAAIVIDFAGTRVHVDGADVTDAIRRSEVTLVSSEVAAVPGVRSHMVRLQRLVAAGRTLVTEGRDQGTVVFPDALCKFFLTATPEARAARRQEELAREGKEIELEEILAQQTLRDQRDLSREVAPLKPAEDACIVETTALTLEEVVATLESRVRERLATISPVGQSSATTK